MNDQMKLEAATDNWDAMTPEQRAVAIAMDVVTLLQSERITAESGIYLEIGISQPVSYADDLREILRTSTACNVCAIGAVFVAKVAARAASMFNESAKRFQLMMGVVGIGRGAQECVG